MTDCTWPRLPALATGALCGLLLALLPTAPYAQAGSDLAVNISADSARMDERRGVGTYTGNVVVTRGDLTLWADRIIIHAPERRPIRMEAEGNPVRAESPDLDNQPRIATAQRMEYSFDDEVLLLLRDARVQTVTEDARGDRITYDLVRDVISIEGTSTDRVNIIIQPRPE